MKTDGGCQVEQGVVVAGKLPVDELQVVAGHNVCCDDVIVTTDCLAPGWQRTNDLYAVIGKSVQPMSLLKVSLVSTRNVSHIHTQSAPGQCVHFAKQFGQ